MTYRRRLQLFTAAAFLFFFAPQSKAVEVIAGHNSFFVAPADFGLPQAGYVEVYWQIAPGSLHYIKNATGLVSANVKTDVVISSNGKTVAEDHYTLQTKPMSIADAAQQNLFEFKKFYLLTGNYTVTVKLSEAGFESKNYSYTDSFSLTPPTTQHPFFSDLQNIDTAVESTDKKNVFYANGYQLLPYVTNFIDDYRKHINLYIELYNLKTITKEQYPLTERIFISKGNDGVPAGDAITIDTIKKAGNSFLLKRYDLSSLSSGNYNVNARLTDKAGNALAEKEYFFQLINKHPVEHLHQPTAAKTEKQEPATSYVDLGKTFVAKYDFTEVRAIMEMLIPVSDPVEASGIIHLLKRPDENYMRYLIYNHFEKINRKEPAKAWTEYTDKVKEVNRLFGKGSTPGYKTDRGKVYLKYGKPDDRVIVNNERGTYPYEIWQYFAVGETSKEGLFLFFLPGTSVEYRLLYSTVVGEPHNTDWRNYLYLGNNPTSRAEQYLNNK